jgi:FAD synthase
MESTTFESRVIHGKGIAKKSLGFPTANLEVTHHIE